MASFKMGTTRQSQDLQENAHLWYKVRVFLFDLRNFKEREGSRDRLELVVDPAYIGAPYFEPAEAERLKSIVINDNGQTLDILVQTTLEERLNRQIRKRVESGDFHVCAAHDLAPVFEGCLGVKSKELRMDKKFVKLVDRNGLGFDAREIRSETTKKLD